MKRVRLTTLTCLAALASLSPAWACSYLASTFADSRAFQQKLWAEADVIFLARASPMEDGESQLRPVTSLKGSRPPERSVTRVVANCGERAADGLVIAYARRLRPADVPWQPWRWGRWYVLNHVAPHEVVDPDLVIALKKRADRLQVK